MITPVELKSAREPLSRRAATPDPRRNLNNQRTRKVAVQIPTVDLHHLLSLRRKPVNAQTILRRHDHLQQSNPEPLHIRRSNAALEHRILHPLAEALANLSHLPQAARKVINSFQFRQNPPRKPGKRIKSPSRLRWKGTDIRRNIVDILR